jgi:hypothetical protein
VPRDTDRLARTIVQLERNLDAVSRTAQLGRSTIGTVPVADALEQGAAAAGEVTVLRDDLDATVADGETTRDMLAEADALLDEAMEMVDAQLADAQVELAALATDLATLDTTLANLDADLTAAQGDITAAQSLAETAQSAAQAATGAAAQARTVADSAATTASEAKTDATTKAAAAQSAAEAYAKAKAEAEAAAAVAAASGDATAKANAAQAAAVAAAALDAKNKADAAQAAAEAKAAAAQSTANAAAGAASTADAKAVAAQNAVNALTGRVSNVETAMTGLNGDLTDLNDDLTAAQSDIAAAEALAVSARGTADAIAARGLDLITNGSATLDTNRNFSQFVLARGDQPPGTAGAYYSTIEVPHVRTLDEFVPVDPDKPLLAAMWVRQANPGVTSRFYFGVSPYDADNLAILPSHYMEQAGSRTTLAAALNPGDTKITLASAAGWNNAAGSATYNRSLLAWNYVDGKGKAWAPGTYSRNLYSNIYDDGAISGNVITLRVPWAGPAIPAGTAVSNGSSGGQYMYAVGMSNVIAPAAWTRFTATTPYRGIHTDTTTAATTAWPVATSQARVVILTNYSVTGGTSRQLFSGLSLSESAAVAAIKPGVFSSTSLPGTTTAPQGSIWFQVNASGEVVAQLEQTGVGVSAAWTTRKVTSEVIANLDAGKITSGSIDAGRIGAASIVADKLAANAVTAAKIAAGAVTTDKMTANSINGDRLAANTVAADKIVANSITASQIAANAIGADQVAANAVTAGKIAANAVEAAKIAAGAVTTDKMTANSINGDRIAANTLHADKIVALSIGAAKIAANAITTDKIVANAVTADKLLVNQAFVDKLFVNDLLTNTLTGRTLVGTNIRTADTGARMTMYSGPALDMYDVSNRWRATMQMSADGNTPTIVLKDEQGYDRVSISHLGYVLADAAGVVQARMTTDGLQVHNDGAFHLYGHTARFGVIERATGAGISAGLRVWGGSEGASNWAYTSMESFTDGPLVRLGGVTSRTTTAAANIRIGTEGNLAMSTSVKASKLDVRDEASGIDLLKVTYRSWLDKQAMIDAVLGRGAEPMRRITGAVAEEMEQVAPELCTYDTDGNLTGIAYDRVALALFPILRDLVNRVEAVEGQPLTVWPESPSYDDTALLDEVTAFGAYPQEPADVGQQPTPPSAADPEPVAPPAQPGEETL